VRHILDQFIDEIHNLRDVFVHDLADLRDLFVHKMDYHNPHALRVAARERAHLALRRAQNGDEHRRSGVFPCPCLAAGTSLLRNKSPEYATNPTLRTG
jgi:hypothetical protein